MPVIDRPSSIGSCCAAVLALLAPVPGCAAGTELSPVIVDGERASLDGSGATSRIDVDPLSAIDLAELLAGLPGVQVRSAGGLGSYSEAGLRGSNGRQVRVLLDGLPLDTGGGEASSLSLVSPLLLSSVEVHKGRVPVGIGSGLAGTINLRSRTTLPAPLTAQVRVGSFGERQVHAAAQLADPVQFAAGTREADNDFTYRNTFGAFDPADPERNRHEHRRNAGTRQHYAWLRYAGPMQLTAHAVDDTQELPTRLNAEGTAARLQTQSLALALSSPPGADWRTSLSHRHTRERFRDPDSELGLQAQDTRDDTHRSALSVNGTVGRLDAAARIEHEDYRSRDALDGGAAIDAERLAAETGLQWQSATPWQLDASLQLGWSRDRHDGDRPAHWRIEPAVGLSRRFDACRIAANLGHRERLPTFFERYGDRGLFKGNPELSPERAAYADLGTRCLLANVDMELTAFGQDLHDAISPTYNGQGIGRSVNTERALIYGIEFGAGRSWNGWEWHLGGTWQQTEDRSAVRASRGKQLPGRYQQQLDTRLSYGWPTLRLQYAFRYEAGQYYDSANLLEAEPLRRHDLAAFGSVGAFGWSLQWLNLRDDNAEQFTGFPTPGRRWLLSLTWPATAVSSPRSSP